jgi:protein-S-isoprenylcysteine O-methyltransferase Ste14
MKSSRNADGRGAGLANRWKDVLAAAVWAPLVGYRLGSFLGRPTLLDAGLFLFTAIITALLVIRRPASTRGTRASFWLAMAATFVPGAFLAPRGSGAPDVARVLEGAGLIVMILALGFLNRSFGIAPAHRGLVTRGPYAVVRHPLYMGEMIVIVGYCVGYASLSNALIVLATLIAQLLRIRSEEALLSKDPTYREYRAHVRWRLLPAVW